jgi:2-polyprenyl-6-methoxyphenol hydroxylase-like FAD-dependent oxidoreductase
MTAYDLIIVGGGIGGSALATVMARAGRRVLLLEKTETFEDHVRGEWMAPWGVTETRRLGLYDLLIAAGAHHLTKHLHFDDSRTPEEAEAAAVPLGVFAPDVPGPLCLGHPKHCQVLIEAAAAAGAEVRRGVNVVEVQVGENPRVAWTKDGPRQEAAARLIVGADGRTSSVREAAGLTLTADPPHHMIGGLLVEDAVGWENTTQAIGTQDGFNFLAFPQGEGRVRLYGCFPIGDRGRFAGAEGTTRFLDAFRFRSSPNNRFLADATRAGPLLSYFNHDAWTERPFAPGVVLIGDAAGWNDPIIGMGLSITYRDVRIVGDLLLETENWSGPIFDAYAEERVERMRRLRFVATITASLDAEFDEAALERRRAWLSLASRDQTLFLHGLAVLAGPEMAPPETFTPAYRARVLGVRAS